MYYILSFFNHFYYYCYCYVDDDDDYHFLNYHYNFYYVLDAYIEKMYGMIWALLDGDMGTLKESDLV